MNDIAQIFAVGGRDITFEWSDSSLTARRGINEVGSVEIDLDGYREKYGLVGKSVPLLRAYALVELLFKEDLKVLESLGDRKIPYAAYTPVHLFGEQGVEKDLFARLIHGDGPLTGDKPYFEVNCGQLPAFSLLRVLFGEVRTPNYGIFDRIDGGVLYLHDIDHLPMEVQSRLKDAVSRHTYTRVNGSQELHYRGRIITSSSQDLLKCVSEGSLRGDLANIISQYKISIPSLAERGLIDIGMIIAYILQSHKQEQRVPTLSEPARTALFEYPWPGNVEELKDVLRNSIINAKYGEIQIDHIQKIRGNKGIGRNVVEAIEVLARTGWTEEQVAVAYARSVFQRIGRYDRTGEALGISFKTLKKRLGEDSK